MSDRHDSHSEARSLLNSFAFGARLAVEVARLRRRGTLLSLLLIDVKPSAPDNAERLRGLAERFRTRVRLHDVLALRESSIALLLLDATMAEGVQAADRLLRPEREEGAPWPSPCAGIATLFDEVEGGRDALVAAAEGALAEAGPGQIVRSRTMEGRPRVLVVDDDESFAQVLAETISEQGWEGHPCCDTVDALERILDGSYSAVFIDVVLAGKRRGIELLRRSIGHDPRRPVVLMSGFDAKHEDIMEALALGPVMFVQKPISKVDLHSALQMFRDRLPGAPKGRPR